MNKSGASAIYSQISTVLLFVDTNSHLMIKQNNLDIKRQIMYESHGLLVFLGPSLGRLDFFLLVGDFFKDKEYSGND